MPGSPWIPSDSRFEPERTISGGHGGGETPVPIPNTAVKPASADGTWGVAPWESRTPPGFLQTTPPAWRGVLSRPGTGIPSLPVQRYRYNRAHGNEQPPWF